MATTLPYSIAYIYIITIIDKFYHIPGPQNIADMATRAGVMLHELAKGSLWQLGPKFLRMPREL